MPKRTDINKILVIGSGPIVIGQAAEFDYAGTQACHRDPICLFLQFPIYPYTDYHQSFQNLGVRYLL